MKLETPERLLGAFVAGAGHLSEPEAERTAGAGAESALEVLVDRGHSITRHPGSWSLACAGRHFDPVRYAGVCASSLGSHLEIWESAPSTNDLAHQGARGGAPHGMAWLAEEQPLGRGRQGRRWECAAHAGLLVSVLLRTPLDADRVPTLLPLSLALGACEALRRETGLDVRTKWPNDLIIGARKLAGLLVEARPGGDAYAVVGLGVNVEADAAPADLRRSAAWIGATAREPLLAQILKGIEARFEQWRRGDLEALRRAWLGLDTVLGRDIRVRSASGEWEGRAETVTANGMLRIKRAQGDTHDVAAGEVHLM